MFYSKIKALQELPQNGHHFAKKKHDAIFGQPMENVHVCMYVCISAIMAYTRCYKIFFLKIIW